MIKLKEIAPYLPYGVKIQASNLGVLELTAISTNNKDYPCWCETRGTWEEQDYNYDLLSKNDCTGKGFNLSEIKPILRPLFDLCREIEHNGEMIVPIIELSKMAFPFMSQSRDREYTLYGGGVDINDGNGSTSYAFWYSPAYNIFKTSSPYLSHFDNLPLFQKLFEYHLDVYGLIARGDAIDINTLNE